MIKSVIVTIALVAAATAMTGAAAKADSEFIMDDLVHDLKDSVLNKMHTKHTATHNKTDPSHSWMRERANAQVTEFVQKLGLPDPDGGPSHRQGEGPKIVGGTPVSQTSAINVFQAALLQASIANDRGAQFCGGSLYQGRYILTAAHCVDFIASPSQVAVLVGSRTLSTTSQGRRIKVTSIKIHPSWNPNTFNFDVAVLTLAETVTTPKSAVLAARGSDPAAGTSNTVSGWGNTESTPAYPTELRSVVVPVVSRTTCNGASSYGGAVSSIMYCAGATGKDSCQGDSGGPATTSSSTSTPYNTLTGIVSWGNGCADAGYPGVYARVGVPAIYDFIIAATQDPTKGWYQAYRSATVAAGATTNQSSPTCPTTRPTATACQASSTAVRIVGEAYPVIGNSNAVSTTRCSCVFKNTGTASATATVRCAAFCAVV
jgi:trypsin